MTRKHGRNAYSNGSCRCDTCRSAHTAWVRERRQENRRRRELVEAGGGRYVVTRIRHGITGYTWHECRCDECCLAKRVANREQQRERSRRSVAVAFEAAAK